MMQKKGHAALPRAAICFSFPDLQRQAPNSSVPPASIAFETKAADREEKEKTHTPPAMPPASSDLAMDDAESVLWFLARSSVALLDPDVLVAASAVDDDGAAMVAKKREEGREGEDKGRGAEGKRQE